MDRWRHKYQLLGQPTGDVPRWRRWALSGAVLFVLLVAGFLVAVSVDLHPGTPKLSTAIPGPTPADARRFVIIVPADNPDPNLCKLLLSATALGYPAPVIVNFGGDFTSGKAKWWFGRSHLAKVTGPLEYLDAMTASTENDVDYLREDDLVVIVDAYDVWFQLPPEVLLRRYQESNRRANARLDGVGQQTIVISAQKRCWPTLDAGSDLHCDALPTSPLRADLYGNDTDAEAEDSYRHTRPRFINSGSMMGPVGDMRRFLRRAKTKIESSPVELFSDQGVLGEILGEQEVWRSWRREHGGDDDNEAVGIANEALEYHVGLDYVQDLFVATVFEEEDGDIIALGNATGIAAESGVRGISPVRLEGVPGDMENATNPLNESWAAMPLYADFYTTAVPVILHHNAHVGHLKQRRELWWDRMWYFPHLRELVQRRLDAPKGWMQALGYVDGVVYYPLEYERDRRRPRRFQGEGGVLPEVEFDVVCRNWDVERGGMWWNEVLRDGKGI